MRIFFLEKFQCADSAPSTALQRAYKGHQRYNLSHSYFPSHNPYILIFVCTIIQRVYIAWNGKFKPCGFFSWKNFKVRTARDRQPYKGPTRSTKDIISLILTFRVITHFDIRLHHYTASVYSMEREIQTMRILFLEEFQSADSARSTALQRFYKVHQRYNLSHSYFPSHNPF